MTGSSVALGIVKEISRLDRGLRIRRIAREDLAIRAQLRFVDDRCRRSGDGARDGRRARPPCIAST
jgi:hypothetical protein